MLINKIVYPDDSFEEQFIEEFCNLKIYPQLNLLESEAGLLSDYAEAYLTDSIKSKIIIIGPQTSDIIFLKNTIINEYQDDHIKIEYYHDSIEPINPNADVVLSVYLDSKNYFKINVYGFTKSLYIKDKLFFNKHFKYYLTNGIMMYSNLICYTMIVKNAGPGLEEVLTANLPIIDRWCILDTGSTDGTQDIIRRILKNKKGTLYEEPFVDFKVSRNRCLELAGHTCKFIIMLDDTYTIKGNLRNFLTQVRGDQFSDSFSLLIQSSDTEYYSNRIIKSTTDLKYIHTIHEVITDTNNINVTIPKNHAVIFDNRSDYMETRTNERKKFDLKLLFKEVQEYPDDPRALYYIAQTYGCIGDELSKAEFFEKRINHPVQGYVQEKIDSLFELARTYNFKINCETLEPLNGPLSQTQWNRCEELYLHAYRLDPKRPDSIYFIGIHYYLQGNYQLAYNYFKKGFEIGYPINSQYSLKPTLSFHFLPKFLTETCYHQGDNVLGEQSALFYLQNNEHSELIQNWLSIHQNLNRMGILNKNPTILKNIVCIVADGGWNTWTGEDILTKGVGGSETWVIEMARHIQKSGKYNVVVFCRTLKSEFFEYVGYNPIELFYEFVANNVVDHCIISRYTEYIPVSIKGHVKNIYIIFHDLLGPEKIIPVHPKIKYIFGLTNWHRDYIRQVFPQFKVKSLYYGSKVSELKPKVKNSFIYSSTANRGLLVLLKMWPRILDILPDSTLNIYCDLEQTWVNTTAPDQMKEIKLLLKINKTGIKLHGWVSKETLSSAWATADYWLYPCIFQETFCLTAREAAMSKTFVISNNLAALKETINNRGLIVEGDASSIIWQNEVIKQLSNLNPEFKEQKIKENHKWGKGKSWKNQADYLMEYFD
jgi:hypothetical protein